MNVVCVYVCVCVCVCLYICTYDDYVCVCGCVCLCVNGIFAFELNEHMWHLFFLNLRVFVKE